MASGLIPHFSDLAQQGDKNFPDLCAPFTIHFSAQQQLILFSLGTKRNVLQVITEAEELQQEQCIIQFICNDGGTF